MRQVQSSSIIQEKVENVSGDTSSKFDYKFEQVAPKQV